MVFRDVIVVMGLRMSWRFLGRGGRNKGKEICVLGRGKYVKRYGICVIWFIWGNESGLVLIEYKI